MCTCVHVVVVSVQTLDAVTLVMMLNVVANWDCGHFQLFNIVRTRCSTTDRDVVHC